MHPSASTAPCSTSSLLANGSDPRPSSAPPHARRLVARQGTARRAWVPSVGPRGRSTADLTPAPPCPCNLRLRGWSGALRPSRRAARAVNSVIPITGTADHLRAEWPITFSGIRSRDLCLAVDGRVRPCSRLEHYFLLRVGRRRGAVALLSIICSLGKGDGLRHGWVLAPATTA
jgi:hypothetical protein